MVSARDNHLSFTLSIPLINLMPLSFYWVDHFIILKATYPISQLACLKKSIYLRHLLFPTKSSIKIAPSSYSCNSPCRNPPLVNLIEDDLAGAYGLNKGSIASNASLILESISSYGLFPLVSTPISIEKFF